MATQDINALAGGTGGEATLPRQVSQDIWKAALEEAVIPQLAKTVPVIIGDNVQPTLTKRPAAYIVGEGQNKTASEIEIGSKSFRPIKAVVGAEFTMEAVEANPAGVLDQLSEEIAGALARQIDLAVIHGRQAADGGQITGAEYLTQTTNEVAISNGDPLIDSKLWEGYSQVVAAGGNFSGVAVDPRLAAYVATARDDKGNRLYPDVSMAGTGYGPFSAINVASGKAVSGAVDGSDDAGILAVAGEFESLRFGRALDIPLTKIEYGDPFGNGDLQRRNAVAYKAEVLFGWAIMDGARFVKYVEATEGDQGND